MAAMDGMPMPGGWSMSMTWMRMPGQTALEAAVSFLGMWIVMMAAMMLPSLIPMLCRFRAAVCRQQSTRLDELTALVAFGYFLVWTLLGAVVFPLGVALAAAEMRLASLARAAPVAAGLVVVIAGALQFTPWKARQLACCRKTLRPGEVLRADAWAAWRHGLSLGLYCSRCCAGLTAILLVVGIMDLRAMAIVTAAVTAERAAPDGMRAARAVGALASGAGILLIARACAA